MKKRKTSSWIMRTVSVLVAAALCTGALAGCGQASDKDEQGRTVLSVGSWPTKEGTNLDNYNARKLRFETENPDVSIVPDPWTFDLKTFFAKAAGGSLPTLFQTPFTEVPAVVDSDYASDLTATLEKRGYDQKFNQQLLEHVTRDGKVMAFPFIAYILGLAFNTEMMEAAGLMEADGTPKQPKDWNEVVDFAVKIKKATGKPGFVFPTANKNGGWIFTALAWSFGVDFMEQGEDGKWKATFNTPEAAEALQFIKDLKWKYDVLPANTLIDGTEYYKNFATGNAGMLIAAGDVPVKVVQYGMTPDQLGIMAMPAGPKRHVTLLGGKVYYLNEHATEDQIDAAFRWIETSYNYNVTEEFELNTRKTLEDALEQNQLVGIKSMSVWSTEAESLKLEHRLIDEMANVNTNHVKLYNDFTLNCPADIQTEEPVCAQELYGILDNCIQAVLTDENADCATLLEKANSDFQVNYLDNLTY